MIFVSLVANIILGSVLVTIAELIWKIQRRASAVVEWAAACRSTPRFSCKCLALRWAVEEWEAAAVDAHLRVSAAVAVASMVSDETPQHHHQPPRITLLHLIPVHVPHLLATAAAVIQASRGIK